ncbi:Recombination protein N [Budvicia aquatica]|uniref:DNA repair protein RecN n=1 Tax=Budvicia aquatica TaxID=82979 RepID=A0A484ZIK7_9GAMM|nr:Recombination protein N [Budvicia aquatica]
MLAQLTISNFAIVRELEIDFQSGMTAITGETGAGKSIAIDALGLCLGSRSEAAMVRSGATRADICARFSLKDTPVARQWLEENQLDDQQECLLRRVISSDGRSRGFINGTAVPVSQLRELGAAVNSNTRPTCTSAVTQAGTPKTPARCLCPSDRIIV